VDASELAAYTEGFSKKMVSSKKRDIIEVFEDQSDLGRYMGRNQESWKNWKICLKALYGIPLSKEEVDTYYKYTGRSVPPTSSGFSEFFAVIGRRGGKSRIAAFIATYEAVYGDWKKYLAPGQDAHVLCLATDTRQARLVFKYIAAFLQTKQSLIVKKSEEEIQLDNSVNIIVKAATSRGIRGYTTAVVILDELAFFRPDTGFANPDKDIVEALVPTMLKGAKLIGISSPHRKGGYFFNIYQSNWGNDASRVLVWQAPTDDMNPTIGEAQQGRLARLNIDTASVEYGAQFREDIQQFIPGYVLDAAIDENIVSRPYNERNRYYAFCDPTGGTGEDSFTLAIAHMDNEESKILLDVVEEEKPPIDLKETTAKFASILKEYGIWEVTGDKYAGDWPASEFRVHNVMYKPAPKEKSRIYSEFEGIINLGKVRLLAQPVIKNQFMSLERRTAGKQDKIDHMRGAHDDVANSVAGVVHKIYCKMYRRLHGDDDDYARIPHTVGAVSGIYTAPPRPKKEGGYDEVVGGIEKVPKERSWVRTSKNTEKEEEEDDRNKVSRTQENPEEELRKWIGGSKIQER